MVVITLLALGAIIGFGIHFLIPWRFSRLIVEIVAGVAGSVVGAIISSPFAPPSEIAQKIIFLTASIIGALLAVFIARAAKI